jgi:hypothetical protein
MPRAVRGEHHFYKVKITFKHRRGTIMHNFRKSLPCVLGGVFPAAGFCLSREGVGSDSRAGHGDRLSCKKRGIFFYLAFSSFYYLF